MFSDYETAPATLNLNTSISMETPNNNSYNQTNTTTSYQQPSPSAAIISPLEQDADAELDEILSLMVTQHNLFQRIPYEFQIQINSTSNPIKLMV